jgi:hypothetical protein
MNDSFCIVYWNQPWLVISKGKNDARFEKEVLTNLHWLKKKWGFENFEKTKTFSDI